MEGSPAPDFWYPKRRQSIYNETDGRELCLVGGIFGSAPLPSPTATLFPDGSASKALAPQGGEYTTVTTLLTRLWIHFEFRRLRPDKRGVGGCLAAHKQQGRAQRLLPWDTLDPPLPTSALYLSTKFQHPDLRRHLCSFDCGPLTIFLSSASTVDLPWQIATTISQLTGLRLTPSR